MVFEFNFDAYAAGTSFSDPKMIDVTAGTYTTFSGYGAKVTYDSPTKKLTFRMKESGYTSTWASTNIYRFHFLSTSGSLPTAPASPTPNYKGYLY